MTNRLPAQRVAIGSLELPGGKRLPVYITVEWLKPLQALAAASGTAAPAPAPAPAPPSPPAADVIDFDYGPPDMVPVLAIELGQGLQALEIDSRVSELQAEVAGLKARLEGLEGSP